MSTKKITIILCILFTISWCNIGVKAQVKSNNDVTQYLKLSPDTREAETGKSLINNPEYNPGQIQTVPDGFLGIPWGASTDDIIKAMKEKGYKQLTGADPGTLNFSGAFAGSPCQLSFNLIANSFYSGLAYFCDRSDYPVVPLSTYKEIVKDLSEKYGTATGIRSDKIKGNSGKEYPVEVAIWDLIDSTTFDKYSIRVTFGVTWFADNTGDQYVVSISYYAGSLYDRLKKKEY